jgi:hypothetical protein
MEMCTHGWMIWMAMAMNVVEAEQEDDVHHTQVDANIASPLNLDFFVFFFVSYCCVHLIYNMILELNLSNPFLLLKIKLL